MHMLCALRQLWSRHTPPKVGIHDVTRCAPRHSTAGAPDSSTRLWESTQSHSAASAYASRQMASWPQPGPSPPLRFTSSRFTPAPGVAPSYLVSSHSASAQVTSCWDIAYASVVMAERKSRVRSTPSGMLLSFSLTTATTQTLRRAAAATVCQTLVKVGLRSETTASTADTQGATAATSQHPRPPREIPVTITLDWSQTTPSAVSLSSTSSTYRHTTMGWKFAAWPFLLVRTKRDCWSRRSPWGVMTTQVSRTFRQHRGPSEYRNSASHSSPHRHSPTPCRKTTTGKGPVV
mmetsp:Transcript_58071/g.124955  ORF Transcript_58071/g.124955 Transcript_58071/m.124955 type:complete len:291 (+) Transcript_58071:1728-2600(+)